TISFTASSTGCVGSWGIYVMNASESKPGITNATASMFSIYPNPTVGTLTINTEVDGRLMVLTIDGRTVGSYDLTAGSNTIQLSSDLAAGVYMCQFKGTDGSIQQVRMVLQR
ncbi:MAG: T9SS type A sorting domain-containing protein, partial [Flavipsychrobacter sp.]|nr:T9SS type A sorting domain-containing protein [Flavipsychrobacter sp.]